MDRLRLVELLVALAAVVGLAAGIALSRAGSRLRARALGRAHNVRGKRGEQAAEALLSRHGYLPIARQARIHYQVEVDDELVAVELHADFVVERAGRRLVAEVKTGRHAPRFEHAETRRQLLEYQLGFGVDSVLLIDVEAEQLREVRFPLARGSARTGYGTWLVAVAAVAGCAYWLTRLS